MNLDKMPDFILFLQFKHFYILFALILSFLSVLYSPEDYRSFLGVSYNVLLTENDPQHISNQTNNEVNSSILIDPIILRHLCSEEKSHKSYTWADSDKLLKYHIQIFRTSFISKFSTTVKNVGQPEK